MTIATLPSRTSSQTYTVCLQDDGSATCTCTAGSFGRPCWHVKALKLAATDTAERRAAEAASLDMLFNSANTTISQMAADRAAAELATLNTEINSMAARIERYGHLMPSGMFQTLQKRYWAARERRAELTGVPLLGL